MARLGLRSHRGRARQGGVISGANRHGVKRSPQVSSRPVKARAGDQTSTAQNGTISMAPRVLISDALSDAAVQIFKDRGVEVDFQPKLGADKDKLATLIGEFDGLAIRS